MTQDVTDTFPLGTAEANWGEETAWSDEIRPQIPVRAAARRALDAWLAKQPLLESATWPVEGLPASSAMAEQANLPARRSPREPEGFELLQKWEGVVLSVEQASFWARLRDLTGGAGEEEAEFLIRELSTQEEEWLLAGAYFYWAIGYEDRNGQRRRVSAIRFRRVGGVRAADEERAREDAQHFAEAFSWQ